MLSDVLKDLDRAMRAVSDAKTAMEAANEAAAMASTAYAGAVEKARTVQAALQTDMAALMPSGGPTGRVRAA